MSSVSNILRAFDPIAESNAEKRETSDLDKRIERLVDKLQRVQGAVSSSIHGNFTAVNTHVSYNLSLSDLKTALEHSAHATNALITYLQLQQNIDPFVDFSVLERVKSASRRLLKHVQLSNLQLTGVLIPVENSPSWYALASNEQFLNRQVLALGELGGNPGILAAKIQNILEDNPDLLTACNKQEFNTPWWFSSLNLTLGKLRLLSGEELNSIAPLLPKNAGVGSPKQVVILNFDCNHK